jgi:tripartite-type tricarboxylate transporter receptor subunit TctC
MQRRRLIAASLALPALVRAQSDYPARPIRVVVPFSPGGAVDGPMRAIAEQLGRRLKQQVIIENKPGAGATIGSEMVAKSAADGYTLLLASQTNAISASLYNKLAFNPIDDFAGISLLGREPGALVVHPSLPVNNVAELVALAKAKPGELNYASSGNGSGQHLFIALFA